MSETLLKVCFLAKNLSLIYLIDDSNIQRDLGTKSNWYRIKLSILIHLQFKIKLQKIPACFTKNRVVVFGISRLEILHAFFGSLNLLLTLGHGNLLVFYQTGKVLDKLLKEVFLILSMKQKKLNCTRVFFVAHEIQACKRRLQEIVGFFHPRTFSWASAKLVVVSSKQKTKTVANCWKIVLEWQEINIFVNKFNRILAHALKSCHDRAEIVGLVHF